MNEERYNTYKKMRRTWGDLKPETKILKSDKVYNRNKAKKEIKKIIDETY